MKKSEVLLKREVLEKALNELPIVWCGTCEHWCGTLKICKPAEEAPPPEIQAQGCDDWAWDGIPF